MAWTTAGNIKGPKGDQGIQGEQGVPGVDGKGISIAGTVPTYADLPAGLGPSDAGKGYLVSADGLLYIWDGSTFPADGAGVEFKGEKGDPGPKGDQGDQGVQGVPGNKGDTGAAATIAVDSTITGAAGTSALVENVGTPNAAAFKFTIPKGDKGDQGNVGAPGTDGTKWFTGAGAPGAIPGSKLGDFYLDSVDGTYYELS